MPWVLCQRAIQLKAGPWHTEGMLVLKTEQVGVHRVPSAEQRGMASTRAASRKKGTGKKHARRQPTAKKGHSSRGSKRTAVEIEPAEEVIARAQREAKKRQPAPAVHLPPRATPRRLSTPVAASVADWRKKMTGRKGFAPPETETAPSTHRIDLMLRRVKTEVEWIIANSKEWESRSSAQRALLEIQDWQQSERQPENQS